MGSIFKRHRRPTLAAAARRGYNFKYDFQINVSHISDTMNKRKLQQWAVLQCYNVLINAIICVYETSGIVSMGKMMTD